MNQIKRGRMYLVLALTGLLAGINQSAASASEPVSAVTQQSYQAVLEQLTSRVRMAGTEGEKEAAEEIAKALEHFGCEVTRQTFELHQREFRLSEAVGIRIQQPLKRIQRSRLCVQIPLRHIAADLL